MLKSRAAIAKQGKGETMEHLKKLRERRLKKEWLKSHKVTKCKPCMGETIQPYTVVPKSYRTLGGVV